MKTRGVNHWPNFASSWDDLGLNVYMADGGRYRRRRFAAFVSAGGTVTRKPPQPHYQSRDYNTLNGGIERWFMPVSDRTSANGFTRGILGACTTIFDAVSPCAEDPVPWHVEMHQFRIEADKDRSGMPTPEGAHRDGVDWVCVLLVDRCKCIERHHPNFHTRRKVTRASVYTHRATRRGLSRRPTRAAWRYTNRSGGSCFESIPRRTSPHLSAR